MRPTYSALLAHPWLATLSKPAAIVEEDEDGSEGQHDFGEQGHGTEDKEVAEWVKKAMERKHLGLMGEAEKPALHKAPLDGVSPAASPG